MTDKQAAIDFVNSSIENSHARNVDIKLLFICGFLSY